MDRRLWPLLHQEHRSPSAAGRCSSGSHPRFTAAAEIPAASIPEAGRHREFAGVAEGRRASGLRRLSTAQAGAFRASSPPAFWEWLAGLVDGDGHLRVVGRSRAMLEITVGLEDRPLLEYVAATLGAGVLRRRPSAKALSYSVHPKAELRRLLVPLAPQLRGDERRPQLAAVWAALGLPGTPPPPVPLEDSSGYWAGYFDADGSLAISGWRNSATASGKPAVAVASRSRANLLPFGERFGGRVRGPYGSRKVIHRWAVASAVALAEVGA